ncbi:MAG TPA: D-mannonate dehydratase ManD [Solirubrobacteraceae bacterium]
MRIEQAAVIVTSPDRNFVTLRLETDDGVVGLGDGTLNGRELAVASYLRDHVAPLLIGRDAHRIEDTWQFLYRGGYWRRGPVTMAAIAAVDVALWDIKAKAAGMPLYQLLGGASRDGLLAYGHASGQDLPELLHSIQQHLDEGYRAIRAQTGIPGLPSVYGVASSANASAGTGAGTDGRYDYEPARRSDLPVQETWDTRAYLRHVPTVFEAVRGEFGPELPLLHDGHHRMTPIQAAQLGKSLEPYDLFWLEDCTPAENQEALRLVRAHTTTPLAIGEIFNTVFDYQTLIREQLIDYVRSAVTHTGGITHLKKLLEYAALYQIKSGMHGPTDVSPVGMAAALHLGLAISNFGIQEYMPHGTLTNEVFEQSYTFAGGFLHPGDNPGLGVDLDLEAAAKYPYQRAYLPYNRLADGTIHDW